MHVLFVHCHPEPASFNAGMTRRASEACAALGWTSEISDLYAEAFDPVEKAAHYRERKVKDFFAPQDEQRHAWKNGTLAPEIVREIERLERADIVVLQFPIWWHSVPAMLKGWCDRVFLSGGLYTSRMRYDRGYFKGRRAVCSVTGGAPQVAHGPGNRAGEIEQILWSINYSLYYMGFEVLEPNVVLGVQGYGFSYADDDDVKRTLEAALSNWAGRMEGLTGETAIGYPGWNDWDEMGRLLEPSASDLS